MTWLRPRHRALLGFIVGTVSVVVVTLVVVSVGSGTSRSVPALFLVVPVVLAAVVGGRLIALAVTVESALAFATEFLPPIGSPRVEFREDLLGLVVFVVVAVAVGLLVASVTISERRRLAAEVARVETLEQVDGERATLLRAASHDLRTPLGIIHAASSELLTGVDYSDASRRELLGLVVDESERLERIVSNLLSLGRIEAGALAPDQSSIDVGELITTALRRLQRLARERVVEVVVPHDLPAVVADLSHVDQVLTNLLENAFRHSPPAGPVRVEARQTKGCVAITVHNDGPGIDPAVRARLFQPYVAGPGSTTTGVGLAISKALVEANGGTIWAGGSSDAGTWISFSLAIDG